MPFPGPIPIAAQTPQQLIPIDQMPVPLDLDDIQGDVLIGLQKKAQRLVFFTINDVQAFKNALRTVILPKIASCADVHRREGELRDRKVAAAKNDPAAPGDLQDLIEMCATNIAFTPHGLQKLVAGFNAGVLPPAFARSSIDVARQCGDPVDFAGRPTLWDPAFPRDSIDGVLNFAGSSRDFVDGTWLKLRSELEHAITEVWADGAIGAVRPGKYEGREHFGWRDGISQPAVQGLADPFPGQDTVPAGAFVIGAPGGSQPTPGLEWMSNGSYMVFRKLEQNVAAFEAFVNAEAAQLGIDQDLLAARIMGRWKSGAPLALAPLADDALLGADALRNNDFDYANDPYQRRCPYAAHARKTNPRGEPNIPGGNQRIMRQGIPYGPEFAEQPQNPRGLLFVCYQADIQNQFEKQQRDWANQSDFPPGRTRPPTRGGPPVRPGLDPVIGQPGQPNAPTPNIYAPPGMPQQQPVGMDEPVPNYPTGSNTTMLPPSAAQTYVTARATLYLFVPSKSAIEMKLSV